MLLLSMRRFQVPIQRRAALSTRLAGLWTLLLLPLAAPAQEMVSLTAPKEAWSFGNGAEFPGATGGLTFDAQTQREGRDSLKLVGDFTKGGNYVQAGRNIDDVDVRELSLWVRNPDADRFTLRLNDASGQTHQFVLKTETLPGWQRVVFPLERFFARRGQADAVAGVVRYESWGGAKDGRWHGPAKAIYLCLDNPHKDAKVRTLWINDVAILPRPEEAAGAEATATIRLDEIVEGEHDWRFSRGEEFPGAKGSLTVVKDQPAAGQSCLELAGDFTGGGAYVAAIKELGDLDAKDLAAVRLRVKSDNTAILGVQLVDGTGQTHQQKGVKISPDGQWHDLEIKPAQVAGGEHWGGANDGKWHGPAKQFVISLSDKSDEKTRRPVVSLADVRAEVLLPVFVQPAAFKSDFEGAARLADGWTVKGDVSIDTTTAFKGGHSLVLSRPADRVDRPCPSPGRCSRGAGEVGSPPGVQGRTCTRRTTRTAASSTWSVSTKRARSSSASPSPMYSAGTTGRR